MDNSKSISLRKHQQITQANRMMFLWIAGVSVIVGIAVVMGIFLVQKILFNEKVINEKNRTVKVLEGNLSVVDDLRENIRLLDANPALAYTKLSESDPAIQSVLDALPANANPTALASSLQTKLLAGVQGVNIESISVESAREAVPDETSSSSSVMVIDSTSNEIGYSFSVSTDADKYDSLRQVLEKIERSIRPFNNRSIGIETQGMKVVMTVKGVSYFEPAKTVKLSSKVVKP